MDAKVATAAGPFGRFLERAQILLCHLRAAEEEVKAVLLEYETAHTAEDELYRSISTLEGLAMELQGQAPVDEALSMAVFLPLNLPLYSLVLFAVAPSAHAGSVAVRAPACMLDVLTRLIGILRLKECFPGISLQNVTRGTFVRVYAQQSDIILFTGKYANAVAVQHACPQALFIYNGSGINPAIVLKNAETEVAAAKIFEMRTFNSGQDCAGTDAIFVQAEQIAPFMRALDAFIASASVGPSGRADVRISPIMRTEYVRELARYLERHASWIVRRGHIDVETRTVTSHVLCRRASEFDGDYHEFFAPIFNLIVFDSLDELLPIFQSQHMKDYSMYVSYFGHSAGLRDLVDPGVLIDNQIVNDVEQGNNPYGGFGAKANFVGFGNRKSVHPILISRVVSQFFNDDLL